MLTGAFGGGSGYDAKPVQANLLNPATVEQANTQYGNVESGLKQQQDFINALNAQNGIANQSSVFNQLQGVANGTGPNPAQAMLNNSTGQNVANQAALMASQRGSGANTGLIARQAAQQGGNIQQQAAGQGAALQAQQSLNAMNQLGGIAGQQVGTQANAVGNYNNFAQGAQGQTLNQINAQNQAALGQTGQTNAFNLGLAQQKAGKQDDILGSVTSALGSGLSDLWSGAGDLFGGAGDYLGVLGAGAAEMAPAVGGFAETYGPYMVAAKGGEVPSKGPSSNVGKHFHKMAQGGRVPALVSPGEKYLSPKDVKRVEQGASPMKAGETIPGKAKVSGAKNSYANDTVSKSLESGGIILPRSVTQSSKPDKKAEEFIAAILARKGKGLKK